MPIFEKLVGSAAIICGIWGIADVVRHLRAGRTRSVSPRERRSAWPLFFRSVVPLAVGIVLITGSTGRPVAEWLLDVVAGVLLAWLVIAQLSPWLKSRRQRRADLSRG